MTVFPGGCVIESGGTWAEAAVVTGLRHQMAPEQLENVQLQKLRKDPEMLKL